MPRRLAELLYPRYFWERVVEESARQGADPRLVLSVMREESRFDVRAKSPAAARGLLQFIIGTARAVGQKLGLMDVQPEDLYQADVIIPLGAKYLADLVREFGGNRYQAVAAYNGMEGRSRGAEPKAGFLLGTREYLCNVPVFKDGSRLRVRARKDIHESGGISSLACRIVDEAGAELASAQLTVFEVDDLKAALKGKP